VAEIGVFFSCEERTALEIVAGAERAEQAVPFGLDLGSFHPWNDAQGQSPFVWSVLGAAAAVTDSMRWTTAVTCPTVRTHPGIVAHAAATTATMMPGRFRLGVGSGEALNEHVFGARWPAADVRLEMLEEAVAVIRMLWEGGFKNHHGRHYTLEAARLYSLPEEPPAILVSGFGPKAIKLAARIGDGYVTVVPDRDAAQRYREHGGGGPITGGLKVCWGEHRDECIRTAHRLWPNEALSGELAQVLPSPRHFEDAARHRAADRVVAAVRKRSRRACRGDPGLRRCRLRRDLRRTDRLRARRLHRLLRARDPAALLRLRKRDPATPRGLLAGQAWYGC